MAEGYLKWYDHRTRFGLVVPDNGGPDLPIHGWHINGGDTHDPDLRDPLANGERVAFAVEQWADGPVAVKLTPLGNRQPVERPGLLRRLFGRPRGACPRHTAAT